MSGNITSIFMIVVIAIVLFGGLGFQMLEIDNKNTILTGNSRAALDNYNNEVNTQLPVDTLKINESNDNITSGSGAEDFSREFRESKAIVENVKTSITSVYKLPGLFVSSAGIQKDDQVNFYLTVFGFVLFFIVILAIYIAWASKEVKNR